MKVASNVAAAHEAVSGFAAVHTGGGGKQVALGSSTVSSMRDGAMAASTMLTSIDELASAVKGQASAVTALALEIEGRDKRDAAGWCEAR